MKHALLAFAFLAAMAAAPASAVEPKRIAPQNSEIAGDCKSSRDDCRRGSRSFRRADCHRDVRTHRIGGERIRHRHVGENCAVREVRRSSSAGRP